MKKSIVLFMFCFSTLFSLGEADEYTYKTWTPPVHARGLKTQALKGAPRYVAFDNNQPTVKIGVINQSSAVDSVLLEAILAAVTKQVVDDFFPYYGVGVNFRVLEDSSDDWDVYVPLIITDTLTNPPQALAFHSMEDSTNRNGIPIHEFVVDSPVLANGTPYIVIPLGTIKGSYGVIPTAGSQNPFSPPTFETVLSFAISHEVLETLHNYGVNKYYSYQKFKGNTMISIDYFVAEVCDPVEHSPGYLIDGFNMSNFVLPSYWVPELAEGPFDFLDTVPAPLTPYAGELMYTATNSYGSQNYILSSSPYDPETLQHIPQEILFSSRRPNDRGRGRGNAGDLHLMHLIEDPIIVEEFEGN